MPAQGELRVFCARLWPWAQGAARRGRKHTHRCSSSKGFLLNADMQMCISSCRLHEALSLFLLVSSVCRAARGLSRTRVGVLHQQGAAQLPGCAAALAVTTREGEENTPLPSGSGLCIPIEMLL